MATKRKTAAPKTTKAVEAPPEEPTVEAHEGTHRKCYAMEQFISELIEMYPELSFEIGAYDGWNVAHRMDVDLKPLDPIDRGMIVDLAISISDDDRVDSVVFEGTATESGLGHEIATIQFNGSPRIRDSRAPFNLGEAFAVLSADEEGSL